MQNFRVKTAATSVAIASMGTFAISMTAQATTVATVGTNFTGTSISQSGFFPPDTMGAVGPNHIVELINGSYTVYNKNGSVLSRISLNQFWQNAGATPAGNFAFDPRVNYDPFSGRWFAASVDNTRGINNFLVAVSQSSNPLDGWNGYAIPSDTPANTRWADFDTLGFNGQSVTLSANMFPIGSGTITTTILTLDKAQLIAGNPTGTIFQNNNPNDTGFTVQPVVDLDNRNNPHPLLSGYNTPAGQFKRSDITGNPATATLSTTGGIISVTAYDNPLTARQPGGPNNVNTGDLRFSSNVVYQLDSLGSNSFWGVQTVKSPVSGAASALRWFEIDANTNSLRQEGLIYDPTGLEDYYYGSLAVNDQREVVIGFSCSGPNLFISSCAVVGEDSGGTTTFGNRLLLKQGSASYQRLDSSNRNRWGDYSATVLDPSDPTGRTFWTFQEFAAGSTEWSTQITEIKLSKVNVPESSSIFSLLALGTLGAASTLKRKLKP